MFTLNNLKVNAGAKRVSKALGRGIASGKGKTAGRGGKGQTARSGVAVGVKEGGQTRLYMRLPKRGFNNPTRKEYEVVSLWQLQSLLDKGYIKANDRVDQVMLKGFGICSGKKPLKLLAEGEIKSTIILVAHKASKKALEMLEAAGGKLVPPTNN
jgi:large subunit ribosomal protein L15